MREEQADAAAAHAPAQPDYYAALGLTSTASAEEVRRAYHRLAKLWHPDRFMHAPEALRQRAERRMRTLTAAYAVLGNAEARRAYDVRRGLDAGADARHDEVPLVFQQDGRFWAGAWGFGAATPSRSMGRRGTADGGNIFFALLAGIILLLMIMFARNGGGASGGMMAFGTVLLLLILLVWALSAPSGGATGQARPGWMDAEPPTPPEDRMPHAPTADDTPRTEFERLVDEALAGVPARFQPYLENVAVRVEPEPSAADLEAVGGREGGLLLGLYHGVNLTHQHAFGSGPEEITIYQGPIERYCLGDPERIRHQVLATVLHELAHHFGLEHEDMPEWVKG